MYAEMVLSQEERAAIGCVAVESAMLEKYIEVGLWQMLSLADGGSAQAVTGGMLWTHKYGLFERLVKARGGAMADDFEPLRKRIDDAMIKRRQIIHGYWQFPEGGTTKNYLRAMLDQAERGEDMEPFAALKKHPPVKASSVIQVANELSRLQYVLGQFLTKHVFYP